MKNRLALRIDNPCSEKWSEMTPNERGRHCASCQKTVFDITTLTDNEILQMVKEHPDGFCGQLRDDQLNRVIIPTQLKGDKWKLNTLVTGALMALGATASSAQSAPTHTVQTQVIDEHHPTGPVCIRETPKDSLSDVQVTVTVHADSLTGEPLRSARVTLQGTDIFAYTDSTGTAVLTIPGSHINDSMSLFVGYLGYVGKSIPISSSPNSLAVDVVLNEQIHVIYGGVVAYVHEPGEPKKVEEKKKIFRKK